MTLLIGLTGGIGTGKTTVSRMLGALGVPVVDADSVAAELMQPGQLVFNNIIGHFGQGVLCQNGMVDRAKLGAIVFNSATERRMLEGLSHPPIWSVMWERYMSLKADDHCAVVFEVPLLIEAGFDSNVNEVWVVACSPENQLKRVMARGFLKEEAEVRIMSQMPLSEKIRMAHRVINTDTAYETTKEQVEGYYRQLCGGGC